LTPTQSDVAPSGTEAQSSVGTVQSALIAWYPPLSPVRAYPDQLGEVQPGDDAGGSVVVVVLVVVVLVVVVLVVVGFPASTTFR
jgi:hypothetical protein